MIFNPSLQLYESGPHGVIDVLALAKRWGTRAIEIMVPLILPNIPLYKKKYILQRKMLYARAEWLYGMEFSDVYCCMDDVLGFEKKINITPVIVANNDKTSLNSRSWIDESTSLESVLGISRLKTNNKYAYTEKNSNTSAQQSKQTMYNPAPILAKASSAYGQVNGSEDINKLEAQPAQASQKNERLASELDKGKPPSRTDAANLARKRKHARVLVAKITEAAKLAHAITDEGPKRGGLPWSEDEVKAKAEELGLALSGEVLAAFKAGMPPDLVKQTRGARPTTPPDNSPASSTEFPDFVGSED